MFTDGKQNTNNEKKQTKNSATDRLRNLLEASLTVVAVEPGLACPRR